MSPGPTRFVITYLISTALLAQPLTVWIICQIFKIALHVFAVAVPKSVPRVATFDPDEIADSLLVHTWAIPAGPIIVISGEFIFHLEADACGVVRRPSILFERGGSVSHFFITNIESLCTRRYVLRLFRDFSSLIHPNLPCG